MPETTYGQNKFFVINRVYDRLRSEFLSAVQRRVSEKTCELSERSITALVNQFVSSCADLGGGDPQLFLDAYEENSGKAMRLIIMFVTVLNELPEGGILEPDLWEKVMSTVYD